MPQPRKRPLVDPTQYYAYLWFYQRRCIYAGYGKDNRGRPTATACWNGRSKACVELLKLHASKVSVRIFPCESKEEARNLERKLLSRYKPKFNTAPQYGGWRGMHTKEGLASISKARKGAKMPEGFGEKVRQRMLGNKNLVGHVHSEETKAKISRAGLGRKQSEEARLKISKTKRMKGIINALNV